MLVAASILLALVALLSVPLHVAFRLEGIEPFAGRVELGWLFGLVRFRVPVPGRRKRSRKPAREEKAARERARRKGRGKGKRVLAALRQERFRERVLRLVRDLLRATRFRRFRLRMRLGLGDPADTGRLWAVLAPLAAVALSRTPGRADVRIEPDFVEPALEFRTGGRVEVMPLQILALAVLFALSPASIRAWRVLGRSDA